MSHVCHAAIIDIGSNSIRLVVYNGPRRAPAVLFNEKVLAGLGAGLSETGMLSKPAMSRALAALRRYHALVEQMYVGQLRVVATAAVRDAQNASEFLDEIARIGLKVEVLSGDDEAVAAGYGVISAIPDADGIVGDLGGGSLELIRVSGGEVHERVSLPLGVLRLKRVIAQGPQAFEKHITSAIREVGWDKAAQGLPLYLVGGSWRTLARFHMAISDYPLPVIHNYTIPVAACPTLITSIDRIGTQQLKAMAAISPSRLPMLGDAARILAAVADRLKPAQLIVSAHGLREGLLYQDLTHQERMEDPLIAAAQAEGARQGRFAEHGNVLNDWIAPLFGDEMVELQRLRYATCQLSDVSWKINPDFRAERGIDVALHGNWVGVDARGRALMAQALFTGFGGGQNTPAVLAALASAADFERAMRWGLAIRLAQRLSGGLAGPLLRCSISLSNSAVILHVPHEDSAIFGDVVERRHKNLAAAFGLQSQIVIV